VISLVVPCYNEEYRLNIQYWSEVIHKHAEVNFLFVDDGSRDETLRILKSLQIFSNVQVLSLKTNSGKGEAVRQGFHQVVRGKNMSFPEPVIIGFLDCDGAFSQEDIQTVINQSSRLLSNEGGYEALITSRVKLLGRKIERSNFRHFIGRLIATFISLGWPNAPYDSQSGFKMFLLTNELQFVISREFQTKWFFDLEILSSLRIGTIYEFPLNEWTEVNGSHLDLTSIVRVLSEVLKVRRIIKKNKNKK